ncbi:MAG TPA: ATP-binding protein [Candidatus Acidoferrales bacterium]|nr:ATP-binding protein [Candidatus Acidoferrales bacterium]
MVRLDPLPASALYRATDAASLGFATTDELADLDSIVGQQRAVEAVEFAIGIRHEGYNLFALGPAGTGKHTVLRQFLAGQAALEPVPSDWVYVHAFDQPQAPQALRLPPGRAVSLRDGMDRPASELRRAIPAAFESDAYRERREAIDADLRDRRDALLASFEQQARSTGVALVRTPVGMALAPLQGEQVLGSEQFHQLPEAEQQRIRAAMAALEEELGALVHRVQGWEREQREKLRQLDRDVTHAATDHLVEELRKAFADLPDVLAHLDAVERNVVDTGDEFVAAAAREDAGGGAGGASGPSGTTGMGNALRELTLELGTFRRFRVNVLVDHGQSSGAPVVYQDNPTLANLVGRIDQMAQLGALITDFTLIKPGALHRANGGFLVLDALRLLQEPYAWESLKRALRAREIRVESPGQLLGLATTVSLQPMPIPLDVKIALVGERTLYYALAAADPDFLELFNWAASTVDEAIEQLTGVPAGMQPSDGGWPEGSVNGLVARRLAELAERARSFRAET